MFFRLIPLLMSFALVFPAKADEIYLEADLWCPYTCVPNSSQEGYLIDLARAIFEPLGHQVNYQTLPWPRALKNAQTLENHAAVGAGPDEGEDLIFPDETVGQAVNVFVTHHTSSWRFTGVSSLKGQRIAAVNGYQYSDVIDQYLSENQDKIHWLFGDDPLSKGLKMLRAGHIDTLLDDKNVVIETARRESLLSRIRFAGDVNPAVNLYIAFSPVSPKGKMYARQLSEGVQRLRETGELQKILQRYDLNDWER